MPVLMGCSWKLGKTNYCTLEKSCAEAGVSECCVGHVSNSTASLYC